MPPYTLPIDPPHLREVASPKQVTLHLLLRKVPTAFSFLSSLRRIDKRHTSNTRTIDDNDDDEDDDDDDDNNNILAIF